MKLEPPEIRMRDRSLKVEPQPDGTYKLTGIAYVADEPNVNNVVYTKAALEQAVKGLNDGGLMIPVTIGMSSEQAQRAPALADTVGYVQKGVIEGDELRCEVETLSSPSVRERVEAVVAFAKQGLYAFAGACHAKTSQRLRLPEGSQGGDLESDSLQVDEFKIISIGLVPLKDVTPQSER